MRKGKELEKKQMKEEEDRRETGGKGRAATHLAWVCAQPQHGQQQRVGGGRVAAQGVDQPLQRQKHLQRDRRKVTHGLRKLLTKGREFAQGIDQLCSATNTGRGPWPWTKDTAGDEYDTQFRLLAELAEGELLHGARKSRCNAT